MDSTAFTSADCQRLCADLRGQFGRSFQTPEVLTPNIDAFFLEYVQRSPPHHHTFRNNFPGGFSSILACVFSGGGSAMQHSYVQIAVCGPSRSSMLTGRRPDSTHVGTGGSHRTRGSWCWCSRSACAPSALFMTLPTYLRQHGFFTAGNVSTKQSSPQRGFRDISNNDY